MADVSYEASAAEKSTPELVRQLTDQVSRLVRDEMRLASAEVQAKGKRIGAGAGMYAGAGLVVLYAIGVLVAAAVAGLAVVFPVWLAALTVGVALLLLAGLLALIGRRNVARGTPPVPEEAIASVKRDIETVKESAQR